MSTIRVWAIRELTAPTERIPSHLVSANDHEFEVAKLREKLARTERERDALYRELLPQRNPTWLMQLIDRAGRD